MRSFADSKYTQVRARLRGIRAPGKKTPLVPFRRRAARARSRHYHLRKGWRAVCAPPNSLAPGCTRGPISRRLAGQHQFPSCYLGPRSGPPWTSDVRRRQSRFGRHVPRWIERGRGYVPVRIPIASVGSALSHQSACDRFQPPLWPANRMFPKHCDKRMHSSGAIARGKRPRASPPNAAGSACNAQHLAHRDPLERLQLQLSTSHRRLGTVVDGCAIAGCCRPL